MDDSEEVPTCPLCLEDLDATDRAMQPCKCSYVVCCWCLNHIREQLNGLCPACRTPYEEQNFTFKEVSTEAAVREAKERATAKKERERREKNKELERERARAAAASQQKARTNLKHARLVQRNLVYVIGLSLTLAREEYIRRGDMFGRFGRIIRVLVNRAHPYNADAPGGPSISAYVQYARDVDASQAARHMNNTVYDGREIRCAIACTKYCDALVRSGVPCGNPDCMYIHEISPSDDVLTREDVLARQLGPPPPSYLFVSQTRRPDAGQHPGQRQHGAAFTASSGGPPLGSAAVNAAATAAAGAAPGSSSASADHFSASPPRSRGGSGGGRSGGGSVHSSSSTGSHGQSGGPSTVLSSRSGRGIPGGATSPAAARLDTTIVGHGSAVLGGASSISSSSAPTLPMHRYPVSSSGRGRSGHVSNTGALPRTVQSQSSVGAHPSHPGASGPSLSGRFSPFPQQSIQGPPSPPGSPHFPHVSAAAESRGSNAPVPSTSSWVSTQPSPSASPPSSVSHRRGGQQSSQRGGSSGQAPEEAKRSRKRAAAPSRNRSSSSAASVARTGSQSSLGASVTQPGVNVPPGFEASSGFGPVGASGGSSGPSAVVTAMPEKGAVFPSRPPGFGAPRPVHQTTSAAGPANPSVLLSRRQVESHSAPTAAPPGFAFPVSTGVSGPASGSGGSAPRPVSPHAAISSSRPRQADRSPAQIASEWGWPGDPSGTGQGAERIAVPSAIAPIAVSRSVYENADAAFSGTGIPFPDVSIQASYGQGRASAAISALPQHPLGDLQVVAAPGTQPNLPSAGLPALRKPLDPRALAPPGIRPSRRSNSRFGFARDDQAHSVPSVPATRDEVTQPALLDVHGIPILGIGNDAQPIPAIPGFLEMGSAQSTNVALATVGAGPNKPVKSRFDFAEREPSPPSGALPPVGGVPGSVPPQVLGLRPVSVHEAQSVASKQGVTPEAPANGLTVSFSQLSTQDKLASLFQSAQWAAEGLPPMPTASSAKPKSVEPSSSDTSNAPSGTTPFPVAETAASIASSSPKRSNSPLVPPGFREATPEPHAVDTTTTSVTAGVATPKGDSDDGKAADSPRIVENLAPALDDPSTKAADTQDHDQTTLADGMRIAGDVGSGLESATDSVNSGKDDSVHEMPTKVKYPLGDGMPDADLISEVELERQVEAARAREARIAAQLSDLQQQIRHFDNVRT